MLLLNLLVVLLLLLLLVVGAVEAALFLESSNRFLRGFIEWCPDILVYLLDLDRTQWNHIETVSGIGLGWQLIDNTHVSCLILGG